MKLKKIFFHVSLTIVLAACSGTNGLYKKGLKLENAGLQQEAIEYYISALSRKPTNVEAKIKLKQTGQKALDNILSDFYQGHSVDDDKRAVEAFQNAEQFHKRVQLAGVELEIPELYFEMFEESKSRLLGQLYQEAQLSLNQRNYSEAHKKLSDIKKLNPSYKDATELYSIAEKEPLYQNALASYDLGEYRKAYKIFTEINATGYYKESKDLASICLENGKYTVALMPIEGQGKERDAAEAITAAIVKSVLNGNNPFIRLLDRSQTEAIIKEQFLNMSTEIDGNDISKTGQILGADVLLIGRIVSVNIQEGVPLRNTYNGFIARPIKKVDPKTGVEATAYSYDRVQYRTVNQSNYANCTFQYRLVSAKTGEVLAADLITLDKKDEVEYLEYNGDIRQLYPGTWGKTPMQDRVDNNFRSRQNINRLFQARRDLSSSTSMASFIFSEIGQKVANSVQNKLDEE